MQYRPEVDGLRAIAVVSVILYHAQITVLGHQLFKGGFIGVDIFFVISGYLITSIILKELVTTGSFSFKHFYERRIRRILPALLFVMLVSLPFAWMYLLPNALLDFSKSILYSLGFSSNFYFHYSGQQYGADSGLFKPFLHTWSLSVEEQFYILFPIVLLITFKYFLKYLIHILILGFVISLGLADWTSKNYSSASFYFLHTRMWELLAGSIMAYIEIAIGHRSENKILNSILTSIGLFLIVINIIFFKSHFPHPSLYSLPAIIGTCLILWFSHKNEIITKILSLKLFVGIGLISYSLYLWHYPIFAFCKIYFYEVRQIQNFFLIILSIILSIVTYFLIERPFRNQNIRLNKILIILLFTFLFILFVLLNILKNDGYNERYEKIFQKNYQDDIFLLLKNTDGVPCIESNFCEFKNKSKNKIILIGDSHLASIAPNLKKRLWENDNYELTTFLNNGCLYLPGFDKINLNNEKVESCSKQYFRKITNYIKSNSNSIIIIGGRFPLYLSGRFFDNKEGGVEGKNWGQKFISDINENVINKTFIDNIHQISKNNKIILLYPIPEVGWHVPSKLLSLKRNGTNIILPKNYITTSYEVFKNRTKTSFELLDAIYGSNIYKVYPHLIFCNNTIKNRCITHNSNTIFYHDDDHPSLSGSVLINELILKEIKKIELSKK